MKEIHQQIRALREENQLSQQDLAKVLHVSRQTISKWELGKSMPDLESIQRLAAYFHVSTDYLIGVELTMWEKFLRFPIRRKVIEMKNHDDSQALVSPWVKDAAAYLLAGKRVDARIEIEGKIYPEMTFAHAPGMPNLQVIVRETQLNFMNGRHPEEPATFHVPIAAIEQLQLSFTYGNTTYLRNIYTLLDIVTAEKTYRLFFRSVRAAHAVFHAPALRAVSKEIDPEFAAAIKAADSNVLENLVRESKNIVHFYGA